MSKEKETRAKKFKEEIGEDATMYGEFICSHDHWLPPEKQKEQAQKMQEITKQDNKVRKEEKNNRKTE